MYWALQKDHIESVEHMRGLFFSRGSSQLALIRSLWVNRNQNLGLKTTELLGLVQSISNNNARAQKDWTHKQENCSISERFTVIHNDPFMLYPVDVFYFAPLLGSIAQFAVQCSRACRPSWWNPLHRAFPGPNQCWSPLHWWGFMAAAYQWWAFNIASAEQSHIIQFVAKKRIKMLIQLWPNNPLK